MRLLKSLIKRAFAAAGYRVERQGKPGPGKVPWETFSNLARAHEHLLNARQPMAVLAPDEGRLALLPRLLGTLPAEAYAILQGLARASAVPGAVCEFGVAQGETSALLAHEILRSTRELHLFDSFAGLPAPTAQDRLKDDIFGLGRIEAYAGTMAFPVERVRARLQAVGFPEARTVIHAGFIADILATDRRLPAAVAFAYVDFDFYAPIKAALEFLDGRTAPGAVIVVDDYDWFSTGAKTAVDEFLAARNAGRERYRCQIPDPALGCFAVLDRVA